jgi:hypothetical protein
VEKLLTPLAQKIILSKKLLEAHQETLTAIVFHERMSPNGRQGILQLALRRFFESRDKIKNLLNKWFACCANAHTESFVATVAPLAEKLDSVQLETLENVTGLRLNVLHF